MDRFVVQYSDGTIAASSFDRRATAADFIRRLRLKVTFAENVFDQFNESLRRIRTRSNVDHVARNSHIHQRLGLEESHRVNGKNEPQRSRRRTIVRFSTNSLKHSLISNAPPLMTQM